MILFCFTYQINEQSFVSLSPLSMQSFSISPNLSLSSLLSSSMPCSSGNKLFKANEKMLSMPIHQNIKHSIGFNRLISKYSTSSDSGRRNTRKKRASDQDCNTGFCCLKSLYFDFHEHGMDNIIRPSGFNMNFCDGECNMQIETNDRDALILQDKINHPESPFRRRLSCCIPIRWSSVEIVEIRNGTEFNRILENVKVMECGCVI
uniref:TGF-beta family profile domain-containing protein n=2 Tax=Wuchereria bancrofti TaxID=6293 RepID=A0AAF5RV61_WUCBA